MGKLMNNDTNYRIIAGEALTVQPVGIRNTDGKVYVFKDGVATDTYIGWSVQECAAGEVAAVVRNGKVGGMTTAANEGELLTVDGSAKLVKATTGKPVVGVIPAGGKAGAEPISVLIITDLVAPAAD